MSLGCLPRCGMQDQIMRKFYARGDYTKARGHSYHSTCSKQQSTVDKRSLLFGGLALAAASATVSASQSYAQTITKTKKRLKSQQRVPNITQKVYFDLQVERPAKNVPESGRVVFALYGEIAPKAVESFVSLASSATQPSYKGSHLYRFVPERFIQGGDIESDNGQGKTSAFGGYFEDDLGGYKVPHKIGALISDSDGPNKNTSKFIVALSDDSNQDGNSLVFGKVIGGIGYLVDLCGLPLDRYSMPSRNPVIVADCGLLPLDYQPTEL